MTVPWLIRRTNLFIASIRLLTSIIEQLEALLAHHVDLGGRLQEVLADLACMASAAITKINIIADDLGLYEEVREVQLD